MTIILLGKINSDVVKTVQSFSPTKVAHMLLIEKLSTAKVIVDATCGWGKDCTFLAQYSPKDALVYAFDIQSTAIEHTAKMLQELDLLQKVILLQDSFVNFSKYVLQPIDIAVFNLGYLPQGDKNITTNVDELKCVIPEIIHKLNNGILLLVSYPGHRQGSEEDMWLQEYFAALDNKNYNIGRYVLLNHTSKAPVVYILENV